MPYSLVLNILPRSPIPASSLSGRHHHALFLDLVQSVDPDLATLLHRQQSEKAFTLSPLQVVTSSLPIGKQGSQEQTPRGKQPRQTRYQPSLPISATSNHLLQFQHDRAIPAGTPCWWRVSLLDETLFGKLSHLWLNLNPNQPWHLGPAALQVTSILGTPQPSLHWANFSTYTQIYEQASDHDRQIHLVFCTPTTFRLTQYDCALPTPELVFRSLLRHWNQYSNICFPKTLIESIYPSFFNIQTEIVIDSRSKLIGCVGEVTFQILGDIDPLTIKQINALADLALYSGIGRKTPMGMGMARRIVLSNQFTNGNAKSR